MILRYAVLALSIVLPGLVASVDAAAQTQSDYWGKPADLKPLLPPIIPPPLIPPHSSITTGSASGESQSANPAYDAQRSAPAPGFRLTIPTR